MKTSVESLYKKSIFEVIYFDIYSNTRGMASETTGTTRLEVDSRTHTHANAKKNSSKSTDSLKTFFEHFFVLKFFFTVHFYCLLLASINATKTFFNFFFFFCQFRFLKINFSWSVLGNPIVDYSVTSIKLKINSENSMKIKKKSNQIKIAIFLSFHA